MPDFGDNPGGLSMVVHVPPKPQESAGLVVAMHGCNQDAAIFDKSGWTALADEWGFYVVFPEQSVMNNAALCFNWWGEPFSEANLVRGEGENQSVASMVEHMLASHPIDPARVFAAGVSSGGAMVAVMLATWPDLFAAGASVAGIPYRCATTYAGALLCMSPGKDEEPGAWGDLVRGAYPEWKGPWPRMMVWQGSLDVVVSPANFDELVEQWTDVHGADQVADATDELDGYERKVYAGGAGSPVVEAVYLAGVTHGVPVDPGAGCGEAGAFFPDADICSTRHIAAFFGLDPDAPPPVEPAPDGGPEEAEPPALAEETADSGPVGDAQPGEDAAPSAAEPGQDAAGSDPDAGPALADGGMPLPEPGPGDTGTPTGGCSRGAGSAEPCAIVLVLALLGVIAARRRCGCSPCGPR